MADMYLHPYVTTRKTNFNLYISGQEREDSECKISKYSSNTPVAHCLIDMRILICSFFSCYSRCMTCSCTVVFAFIPSDKK